LDQSVNYNDAGILDLPLHMAIGSGARRPKLTDRSVTYEREGRTMTRPRLFDEDEVLDKAMELFWYRGFDAVSVNDLLKAVGINKGSFYPAFGGKEQLYARVLTRYWNEVEVPIKARAAAEDPIQGISEVFDIHADRVAQQGGPRGCLLVDTLTGCYAHPKLIEMAKFALADVGDYFTQALDRAISAGRLSSGADTRAAAKTLVAIYCGMAVMAKGAPGLPALRGVATTAMNMLRSTADTAAHIGDGEQDA
jgi:TetR/AcrR family transcriptional repressor of nem operon